MVTVEQKLVHISYTSMALHQCACGYVPADCPVEKMSDRTGDICRASHRYAQVGDAEGASPA